jgi:hypothetical protein
MAAALGILLHVGLFVEDGARWLKLAGRCGAAKLNL